MARAAKGEPVRQAIECPRCGYDVTGTMSLWTESCPLEGRCTECGYEYQWRHLLGANLGVPKWFFETARRRKVRAFLATCIRAWVPWRMWDRIPLHTPFAPERMVVLIAGWILIAYGTTVVAASAENLVIAIAPNVPASWHRRAYLTSHYSMMYVPLVRSIDVRMLAFFTEDLVPVLAWPLRDDGESGVAYGQARLVAYGAVAMALMPVSFLALRSTMAKHRVRKMHIARASAVAISVTLCVVGVWYVVVLARNMVGVWFPRKEFVIDPMIEWAGVQLVVWWPVIMALWWWAVCARYLRIEHPFWTGVLMTLMAFLGSLLVLFPITFDGYFWQYLIR